MFQQIYASLGKTATTIACIERQKEKTKQKKRKGSPEKEAAQTSDSEISLLTEIQKSV